MTLKSSHSARPPSGGGSKVAAKRKAFKRPANKKFSTKKVARKAAASAAHADVRHGAAPVTRYRGGRIDSFAPAVASKPSAFTLIAGKVKGSKFEDFGNLPSAEREAAIKAGLPATFLEEAIAKVGVTRADLLAGLGIASSTAARVKQHGKRFSLEDSERLARLARLWHDALIVYETDEGTQGWITSPVPSAGGVPLAMLATQEGFERAQRSIMQLAYGVFA